MRKEIGRILFSAPHFLGLVVDRKGIFVAGRRAANNWCRITAAIAQYLAQLATGQFIWERSSAAVNAVEPGYGFLSARSVRASLEGGQPVKGVTACCDRSRMRERDI
jgi:hypothetical protein